MASVMGYDQSVGQDHIEKLNQWMTKDYEAELEELPTDGDDVLVIDQTKKG
jgi:hypothetical protein